MEKIKIIFVTILILISVESLWSQNKSNSLSNNESIDIDYVKKMLCNQINTNFNNLERPDSIWITKIKNENLYLTQSYFGSGNPILVNLFWVDSISYKIMDSLFYFWADDLFSPSNIIYNDTLNWFFYIEEGSGTNHYSETKQFIRIENNRFYNLIKLPKYVSDINPEENPLTYFSFETEEIKLSQKKIVIKAKFESGIIENGESKPHITKEDIATFEYSKSCKCFIWSKSTNNDFEKFWKGEIDYSSL